MLPYILLQRWSAPGRLGCGKKGCEKLVSSVRHKYSKPNMSRLAIDDTIKILPISLSFVDSLSRMPAAWWRKLEVDDERIIYRFPPWESAASLKELNSIWWRPQWKYGLPSSVGPYERALCVEVPSRRWICYYASGSELRGHTQPPIFEDAWQIVSLRGNRGEAAISPSAMGC